MTAHDAAIAYARPYARSLEQMRLALPEHGESLHAQLVELHKRPTAEKAETMARNLEAVRLEVMRLRERIAIEGEPNV